MTTLITRTTSSGIGVSAKGSPLTNSELDLNFISLNDDKVEKSTSNVAIGLYAGLNQGLGTVAVGQNAGQTNQQDGAVAVGQVSGSTNQGVSAIAVGSSAGETNQSSNSVAIGYYAGNTDQQASSVAIGDAAAATSQGANAIAIGRNAGNNTQTAGAIAIGYGAGNLTQGGNSIAIGRDAGSQSLGPNSIAIGSQASFYGTGIRSVTIGLNAGMNITGDYAVAIGAFAGEGVLTSNSIVINASGAPINGVDSGLYVSPIRTSEAEFVNVLAYNTSSSEVVSVTSIVVGAGGNVSIGTSNTTTYKLRVAGSFAATTKSFLIDHPTKPGRQLRHGSLEGPENGVYVRGQLTDGNRIIHLPDYWTGLVDAETITVNLTPFGEYQQLYVEKIENNKVYVAGDKFNIRCFYTVWAERKDVDKLEVEI